MDTVSFRLKASGYDVVVAYDGQEALTKTRVEKPDLIILDLMLPKMDGYKVCRMLKFDERYKNSCEDIDLSLKLRKNNWDLMVSSNSFVIHKCGKSIFKSNTNTKISQSRELLLSTWGNNLKNNNL